VWVLLIGGTYEVRRWEGLGYHDIHTKFHDNLFRQLSNLMVIVSTVWEAVVLVLLMGRIYKVCHWDGFRWHYIHTKFHDDRFMHLSNIKGITSAVWEAMMLVLLIRGIIPYDVIGFMTVGSGIQAILSLLPQQYEWLQCWCYWWERFMKYAFR
jgi:hypothetical protein